MKICGLTSREAAEAALKAGADFGGLVFFPASPRHVGLDQARSLAAMLRGRARIVTLMVDPADAQIDEVMAAISPDFLQLHGKETPARVAEIARHVRRPIIKAFPVAESADIAVAHAYDEVADYFLVDAKAEPSATRPGGLGAAFDWQLLGAQLQAAVGVSPVGLTPDNIARAIRIAGPYFVDASSGVEDAPGKKSAEKIAAFVRAARNAQYTNTASGRGMTLVPNSYRLGPDAGGHFGAFGGRYVAETLMPLLLKLEEAYAAAKDDPAFHAELDGLLKHYVGRPSPLYFAERLTRHLGGAKIYFKREELNHTGAHKINNCIGQILLAKRMGKTRIIAETGAGQHGVATATVAARFGLPCVIYMGEVDIERQKPNVFRMNLLGAEVRAVASGSRTLKDAMNEALRDWVANVHDTFYIIGSAAGPHPYPAMVRDFQTVIGNETRAQMMEAEGRLPDLLVACVGGGSNAIGLFHPFPRRSRRRDARRGSGGRGRGNRASRGDAVERHARRAAWRALLSAAGCRRADSGSPFHFRGARLSRRRAGAFLAQGNRGA